MPGRGRKFTFFGAFGSKSAAVRGERKHRGSFIIKTKGKYRVVKRKKYESSILSRRSSE